MVFLCCNSDECWLFLLGGAQLQLLHSSVLTTGTVFSLLPIKVEQGPGPGQSHRNESDLSLRTSDSSLPSSLLIWLIEFILCLARPGPAWPDSSVQDLSSSLLAPKYSVLVSCWPGRAAGRLGGVTTQSPSCSPADLWDVRPCRLETGPGLLLQEMMECHPWLSWLPHGCTALHSSRMMTVTASQQTS